MYEETRKVEVIMIRPIVKDILFLGEKSEAATKADIAVIDDLIDTLRANLEDCVGMAALICLLDTSCSLLQVIVLNYE